MAFESVSSAAPRSRRSHDANAVIHSRSRRATSRDERAAPSSRRTSRRRESRRGGDGGRGRGPGRRRAGNARFGAFAPDASSKGAGARSPKRSGAVKKRGSGRCSRRAGSGPTPSSACSRSVRASRGSRSRSIAKRRSRCRSVRSCPQAGVRFALRTPSGDEVTSTVDVVAGETSVIDPNGLLAKRPRRRSRGESDGTPSAASLLARARKELAAGNARGGARRLRAAARDPSREPRGAHRARHDRKARARLESSRRAPSRASTPISVPPDRWRPKPWPERSALCARSGDTADEEARHRELPCRAIRTVSNRPCSSSVWKYCRGYVHCRAMNLRFPRHLCGFARDQVFRSRRLPGDPFDVKTADAGLAGTLVTSGDPRRS